MFTYPLYPDSQEYIYSRSIVFWLSGYVYEQSTITTAVKSAQADLYCTPKTECWLRIAAKSSNPKNPATLTLLQLPQRQESCDTSQESATLRKRGRARAMSGGGTQANGVADLAREVPARLAPESELATVFHPRRAPLR